MPYRFLDLTGNGRHLTITNKAQVVPSLNNVLANTQGAVSMSTTTPTQPAIHYYDSAAFFGPVWGSGSEAFSVVIAGNFTSTPSGAIFMAWTGPTGLDGWYFYSDSTSKISLNMTNAAQSGMYLGTVTTAAPSSGSHIVHGEFRTGAVREANIWIDNVLVAQTRTGTGSIPVVTGNERLQVLSRADGNANTAFGIGLVGFKRGRFTNDERAAQLLALNAA